jgi:hypothetical protein
MAVQTIWLLGTAGVTPNFFGNTQLNGSAPTAANTAFGWGPAKTAVTTPYFRGRLGATTTGSDAAVASSYNAGTSGPTRGTGTGAATAGDSFIAGPFSGTFAATAWTFNCNIRASTAGAVGHINMRFWRSANADGSSATQITANTVGATVTLSTTADVNSSITWSPGALNLNAQYLFFQVEWQETTAGSSNNDNVFFRIGTASITTADYVADALGTLSLTQASQTLSSVGQVRVNGTLSLTQAAQTLAAAGGGLPPITGGVGGSPDTNTVLLIHADGANGSTTFTDASSYAHTLSVINSAQVTTAASKFGTGSAKFDGDSGAFIDTGNVTDFQFGSAPFTIEAWAYYTSAPGSATKAITAVWGPEGNDSWWLGNSNNGLMFLWSTTGVYDGGKVLQPGGFTPTLNTWYHIAADRDASGMLRMYINGAVYASQSITDFFSANGGTCTVGGDHVNAGNGFTGYLDEVRVTKGVARYGGAFTPPTAPFTIAAPLAQANHTIAATGDVPLLPPTAILALTEISDTISAAATVGPDSGISGGLGDPNASIPIPVDLLVHADAAAGTTVFTDASGNNWPITTLGDAHVGSAAKFGTGSMAFGPPSSTISQLAIGGPGDFHIPGFTPFTIEFWAWFNTDPTARTRIFTGKWGPGGNEWVLALVNSGTFTFVYTTNGSDYQLVGLTILASTDIGKWIHFALAGDATNFRAFVNGSIAGFGYRNTPFYLSSSITGIGNDPGDGASANFDGYIDELAITIGTCRYIADFIPPYKPYRAFSDPGYMVQGAQTLAATGTVADPVSGNVGTLNLTQASQTLFGTAKVAVDGTLGLTQQPQTLAATGGVALGATLGLTQAPQTIAAAGGVTVTGTLGLTQQPQTLAAVGRVLVGGALGLTQQSQTLLAAGQILVTGTLSIAQAPQTLSAFGTVVSPGVIVGNLNLTQDDHVLSATGTVPANDTGIMETQYYYRRRMRR